MNKCRLNSLVIALLLLVPCLAFALPGAHDPTSGGYAINCNSCHIQPKSFGNTNTNYTDNVCLTCHLSGTNNTKKVFRPEDFVDMAGTSTVSRGTPVQSSHKWFGTDVVPKAGAQAPVDTSANGLNKNASFVGSLSCVRCHNVHGSSGIQSNTPPYLRAANDNDQMCTNCHRSRDKSNHTFGTHPVNVSYSTAYKANPTLFRAQPDSGNANSQLKIVSGKVVCSSCHKVHAADSRTGTLDNYSTGHAFTNLSTSNGALLRVSPRGKAANDVNICTNCHTNKFAHNKTGQNVQCNDCHGGHVEYDAAANAGDTSNVVNVSLVRRYLSYSAAGRISKRIIYNDSINKKFYTAGGKGVCQSCHNLSNSHFTGGVEANGLTSSRTDCAVCHKHNEATGSFSIGAGACDTCHGYPPPTAAAGYTGNEATSPHVSHAGGSANYSFGCVQCHNGAEGSGLNHNTGSFNDGEFVTKVAVTPGGVISGPNASYNGTQCSNVYCHSDGTSTTTLGSPKTVTWAGGLNTISTCDACHASSPATGSHSKHMSVAGYGCATCHAATVSSNTNISNLSNHVNAVKDVQFNAVGAATGASCSVVACHGNGKGAAPVEVPTWGTAATGDCNSCHLTATGTALATGSHTKHFTVIGSTVPTVVCVRCHTYNGETAVPHVDGTLNVLSSASSCGTCHNSGQGPTGTSTGITTGNPTWGAGALACDGCHKNMKTDGTAPGGHVVHAQTRSIACAVCHNGYTETTSTPATHTDGNVNLAFTAPAASTTYSQGNSGVLGNGYGNCTTSYCHSSGQAANGTATPIYPASAPVWGGAALNCGSCHKNMDTDGSAPGSHIQHAQGTSNIPCAACHNGYTETAASVSTHVDGSINLSFTATGAGTVYSQNLVSAPGNGFGTCSTSICHGSNVPTWGANTSNVTCTKCHGKPTLTNYSTTNAWQAAPGYAQAAGSGTYTNNVSNAAPYGAHDAHVRAVNGYTTREILCSDCHGTIPTSGSHANGTVAYTWSNMAKNVGTSGTPNTRGTLTPNYSAGSCSANYCHGAKLAGGANTTPSWTGTAYLTPYAKNSANCGQCHGAPPTSAPSMFTHGGIAIANDCSGCHGHNGSGALHINGILEAAGDCNSCHDYDTVGGTYSGGKWSGGTWGKLNLGGYATANEGWGAHAKHINFIKTRMGNTIGLEPANQTYGLGEPGNVCGTCHTNSQLAADHVTGATDGSDPTGRTINFGDSTFKLGGSGSIVFGTPNPAYKGLSGTSSSVSGKEKTCSNISCHYFTTPLWSTY